MSRILDFYTDGAYSSKTQMGGWAAVCVEDDQVIDIQQGYEPYTTNNRMELMGFLSALENANTIQTQAQVNIYTDSAYIANCFIQKWWKKWMLNGWKTSDKQEVKNKELWTRIISLYIKLTANVNLQIIKVKGHSGNKYNDYVDILAKAQRELLER